jgi:hypothetical protein
MGEYLELVEQTLKEGSQSSSKLLRKMFSKKLDKSPDKIMGVANQLSHKSQDGRNREADKRDAEYAKGVREPLPPQVTEARIPSPGVEADAQKAHHVISTIATPEAGEQARADKMQKERIRLAKIDDKEAGVYHDAPKKNRAGGGSKIVK